jgi:hypothetical protein
MTWTKFQKQKKIYRSKITCLILYYFRVRTNKKNEVDPDRLINANNVYPLIIGGITKKKKKKEVVGDSYIWLVCIDLVSNYKRTWWTYGEWFEIYNRWK